MAENVLADVKVGDLVVVKGRFDKPRLEKVKSVTPVGRVQTQSGYFNPNGWLRGDHSWNMQHATIPTADDIVEINRLHLVEKLRRYR